MADKEHENTKDVEVEAQEEVIQKRPYEDYVIEDPEDMDTAPDTGDMFDDDDLYDDYDDSSLSLGQRRRKRSGISGSVLALLWCVFALALAAYIYLFFVNDSIISDDVAGKNNTVNMDIPKDANYELCSIDEINQLINNYLLARTKADKATLQRLVTDPSEFDDEESLKRAAEYITSYNRTTCYAVSGYTADSYIIYELSNITIKDVTSTPLDIRSFYIVRQSDGSYRIKNSGMSADESAYVNDVTSSSDIQDIYKHVKENNDYLLKTDKTFKVFQEMLTQ